jgi:hypothetical protein
VDQEEFLSQVLGENAGRLRLAKIGESGEVVYESVDYPLRTPVSGDEWPYFVPALFIDDQEPLDQGKTYSLWADVDDTADSPVLTPSLNCITSPLRFQRFWNIREEITVGEALTLAKRISPASDPGPLARLPGTLNNKYAKPFKVEVSGASLVKYNVAVIRRLPDPNGTALKDLPDFTWEPAGMGPKEFIKNLAGKLGQTFPTQCANASLDFSFLIDMLLSIALPDEEAVYVLRNAACNPFKNQTATARETAKAYARRKATKILTSPFLLEINKLRRNRSGPAFDRKNKITSMCIRALREAGTFLHTIEGEAWYVDREIGQAISLSPGSEKLRNLITMKLGINPTDEQHRHIVLEIIAQTMQQPATARVGDLAHYDEQLHAISVYLGGSRVMRLTANSISETFNGDGDFVFRAPPKFEPIPFEMLDFDTDLSGWWEEFFPGMPNIIGMTEAQASALLHVWTDFILFQQGADARPLLAFTGQPGSGKSTFFRSIYRLIYGVGMELLTISTEGAFDIDMSNHTLALFDNVDKPKDWLNPKLALAISRASSDRRKLYTDNDLFSVTNRALVGINAHTPPFLQPDIIDRLLCLNLRRYEDLGITLLPEKPMHLKTLKNRHRYISGLLQEAQKILATPKPENLEIEWRIADFVSIGRWIARSLGIEDDFMGGLARLKGRQRAMTLEGDQPLVDALEQYAQRCKTASDWKRGAIFWEDVLLYLTPEAEQALKSAYKVPGVFIKKCMTIIGILNKHGIPLEFQIDERTDVTLWRMKPV